jgi:hypothetical protein
MTTPAQRKLADARDRLRLFKELDQACVVLNRIKNDFPKRSPEGKALALIKDALFYVSVRQLDGFRDFLESIPHKNVKRSA